MARRKQATKTSADIEVAAQTIAPIDGVSELHLKEHAQRILTINTTVSRLDKEAQALMLEVAYRLGEVKEGNWFVADGFKSINEFGTKILGYKSNMISKCVQASKRLENHIDANGNYNVHSIFALYADDDSNKVISDFGLTQLFELASTPDEEIQKALINGLISHDTTCTKLREFAKSLKGDKDADSKNLSDGGASTDSKSSDDSSDSTDVSDVSSTDNATNVKAATKTDYMRTFKDLDNDQLLMVIDCALHTLISRGFNAADVAKKVAATVKQPTKADEPIKADEPTKDEPTKTTKASKTTKATKTTKADEVQTI